MKGYGLVKVVVTPWFHWWIISVEALVAPSKIVEHLLATKEMFGSKFWFFIKNSRPLKEFLMLQISLKEFLKYFFLKKLFSPSIYSQYKEHTLIFGGRKHRVWKKMYLCTCKTGFERGRQNDYCLRYEWLDQKYDYVCRILIMSLIA